MQRMPRTGGYGERVSVGEVHQAELDGPPDRTGENLAAGDVALTEALVRSRAEHHLSRLNRLARTADSAQVRGWAQDVESHPPLLRNFAPDGARLDDVDQHPSWHRLLEVGAGAGLNAAAQLADPLARPHTGRAAALMIWSQVETGHTSLLCTTNAVAAALAPDPAARRAWLPRLGSAAYESAPAPAEDKVGALASLAVTERRSGSDVRATTTVASPDAPDGQYRITGDKWFVSSPTADLFLVLAQAPGGLSCFLVPRFRPDGSANHWQLRRLKPTLGGHSVATAEVQLAGSWGRRIGEEGRGGRVLRPTTQALRMDAVTIAAGWLRAGLRAAADHARHNGQAQGQSAIADRPLMQNVLADLAIESEAATVLAMRLAAAMDDGEHDLLRVAVPLSRYWVTKRVSFALAEALECLGGNGYVEEHTLPRLFRAAPALAMWEGSSSAAALDVLRIMSLQPRAIEVLLAEIDRGRGADPLLDKSMDDVAASLQAAAREARRDAAAVEGGARWLVERLAVALQASLMVRHSTGIVTGAYLSTRVAGGGGSLLGTLPVGRRTSAAIVERAVP